MKTVKWKDPVILIFGLGTILALVVSSTPTYYWISLFHAAGKDMSTWNIILTSSALIVMEGGGILSKLMTIWAPKWEGNLNRFMIGFLVMLGVTNFAMGWQSIHSADMEAGSIYAAVRDNWYTAVASVLIYSVIFPAFQGLFMYGLVQRWTSIDSELSENEVLRNEIDHLKSQFHIEKLKLVAGFEAEKNKIKALFQGMLTRETELLMEVESLKNETSGLRRQLEETPMLVAPDPEMEVEIAGRKFTTDGFCDFLNSALVARGVQPFSRSKVYRMLSEQGDETA